MSPRTQGLGTGAADAGTAAVEMTATAVVEETDDGPEAAVPVDMGAKEGGPEGMVPVDVGTGVSANAEEPKTAARSVLIKIRVTT